MQSGKVGITFNLFPILKKIFPASEFEKSMHELKSMMRELIKEHLADMDYDSPRDFIDIYLKQIHEDGTNYDIEHLVVICLDFLQAGGEITRYPHKLYIYTYIS